MRILRLLLSSGSTLAVFSMSCTGVVFITPSMTCRAMFWTLFNLLFLALVAVPREEDDWSYSCCINIGQN